MRRYAGAFLPALLSVALFGVTVFWLVLPGTEQAILAKKRDMIRELTLSVTSLLTTYEQQEQAGLLSKSEAQKRALGRLSQMRYGEDGKDYFWVIDLVPRVLMHPYRHDMEGQEVSQYADGGGKLFFQEFLRVAHEQGQGFVSHSWQWKDDPQRQAGKLTHVRLFKPWGWVVGTGIYTNEVDEDLDKMTRNLTMAGAGIMVMVSLLAGYISWRSISADNQNQLVKNALAESEEKFRSISASALDGIVMLTQEGRISFWNQAAENIFGFATEEVLGMDFLLLLAPARYHAAYRQAFAELQSSGQDAAEGRTMEWTALKKNGEEIPVELSMAPLNLRGRRHAVGIIRDTTRRKMAEASLQQSEEKFRKLFHASPVVLTISTMEEGRLLEVNDTALDLFGLSRQETIGKNSYELGINMHREARQGMVMELRMTGKPLRKEIRLRDKNGNPLDLLWTADPLQYEGQDCLLNVMVDITEAKNARREKEHLEDRLRQAQKMEAIGTLAGGIAHDFNNILSAVLGFSDLALMRLSPEDKAHSYVRRVYQAGLRARELVQQILAFSRQSKLEKSPVEFRLLLKEALKMLRATIPATVSMLTDIQDTNGQVLADPGQLHQIVINLCTNAAQAMGRQGGSLRVTLSQVHLDQPDKKDTEELPPGEYLCLSVEDSGPGMSPQTLERVFEPFFTTKGKGEGTGLGLSVVHGIVRELGGRISVSSAPGQGSVFQVLLPRYDGDHTQDVSDSLALPQGQERILVVDDEETVAQSHRLMLESLGYRVEVCPSSGLALEELRQKRDRFDLLLTDLAMPDMDGVELIRRARQDNPSLPIILITGFADEKHITPELLSELAINRRLLKPVIRTELAQAVRSALDENPPA